MSAAHQRAVVAVLRQAPPEGRPRWTPGAVARAAGLDKAQTDAAIRALRNVGKIKWDALELSASMMESQAKADGEPAAEEAVAVESVSRAGGGARPAAGRTEAATTGDCVATERLDDLGSVQDGLHKCPRTGSAGTRVIGAPVGGSVKPPLIPSATEPSVHPGEHEEVAAAGEGGPLPIVPGHTSNGQPQAPAIAVRSVVAMADLGLPRPVVGELIARIDAWCARNVVSTAEFGRQAMGYPGYYGRICDGSRARARRAALAQNWIDRWPDGCPSEHQADEAERVAALLAAVRSASFDERNPGKSAEQQRAEREDLARRRDEAERARGEHVARSLAAEVKAEALAAGERRALARCTGTVKSPLSANVVVIQSALLAQPEDLFVFLRRKWPRLLAETIALARAEEKTPAAMLVRVIEAGLLCIGDERKEEAA